jgi:hypothetical protein
VPAPPPLSPKEPGTLVTGAGWRAAARGKNPNMAKDFPTEIEVQKYLGGIDYPATKQDLKSHAQRHNAPQEVLGALDLLPDEEFRTPAAISKAFPGKSGNSH